ncbi:MAG: hypothetical protein FWC10_03690 [Lentimicrobiaceae bacterium]|nr:hypothetical protein [Lentimicrobiaceae bacterium]
MKTKTENKHFDTIMQMHSGVDDFKKMVERQHKSRQNLPDITLPHQLWIATKRGCGINTCVNAFAEYLYGSKTFEFSGDVKHFDFNLEYTKPDEYFSEITRFENTLIYLAGHKNHFRGVVSIDVSGWLGRTDERYFQLLLEEIASRNDKILVIFYTNTDDKRDVEKIESSLVSHLRIETLYFKLPNEEELVDFMESKHFSTHKLKLENDAKTLLADSIREMTDSRYFNGLVGIKQFSEDILSKLLVSDVKANKISANMLSSFDKDSHYVKRVIGTKKTEFGFHTQTNRKETNK